MGKTQQQPPHKHNPGPSEPTREMARVTKYQWAPRKQAKVHFILEMFFMCERRKEKEGQDRGG